MNSLEYNNGNEECTLRKRLTNLTRVRQQETLLTSVYLRTFIFLFYNNDYIYREGGGVFQFLGKKSGARSAKRGRRDARGLHVLFFLVHSQKSPKCNLEDLHSLENAPKLNCLCSVKQEKILQIILRICESAFLPHPWDMASDPLHPLLHGFLPNPRPPFSALSKKAAYPKFG